MKKLVILILSILPAFPAAAQFKVAADVEVKEVSGGKLTTTRKHVCCQSGGRLVSFVSYPSEYYLIEEASGESRMYIPASNEYYTNHKGMLSGKGDLLSIFLSRAVYDMGLGAFGYTLKSTRTDGDGYLIRTFVTGKAGAAPVVDLVFKDFMPVCILYKSSDGTVRGKVFLSDYRTVKRFAFPCRTTEIMYMAKNDSLVSRTIYSNLKVDEDDSLFDFVIPSDARPVSLKKQ